MTNREIRKTDAPNKSFDWRIHHSGKADHRPPCYNLKENKVRSYPTVKTNPKRDERKRLRKVVFDENKYGIRRAKRKARLAKRKEQ